MVAIGYHLTVYRYVKYLLNSRIIGMPTFLRHSNISVNSVEACNWWFLLFGSTSLLNKNNDKMCVLVCVCMRVCVCELVCMCMCIKAEKHEEMHKYKLELTKTVYQSYPRVVNAIDNILQQHMNTHGKQNMAITELRFESFGYR